MTKAWAMGLFCMAAVAGCAEVSDVTGVTVEDQQTLGRNLFWCAVSFGLTRDTDAAVECLLGIDSGFAPVEAPLPPARPAARPGA